MRILLLSLVRFALIILLALGIPVTVLGESRGFHVPTGLRPRVNFWKDVFSKYGKHQFLVHHRMYPQIVFRVVDLTAEGRYLSESQFASYRQEQEQFHVAMVRRAVENLAEGRRPASQLERDIERVMSDLGPGHIKYRRILDEDLIRTQTGIRERHASAIVRARRLLPAMEPIFASYGLPRELTRLPFIESSFVSTARSSVGAAGIWQFMKVTAKAYGLKVTNSYDARRDPIAATRAAARYLRDAYERLGSWPLAITSYNHGVGGLKRKIEQVGTTDIVTIIEHPTIRPLGFASTNFYPEFLAAVEVYDERDRLFPAESLQRVAAHEEVSPAVEAKRAAAAPEKRESEVVINKKPLSGSSKPTTVTIRHTVKKKETLSGIASRYGVTISAIRSANKIRGSSIVAGQTLVIPKVSGTNVGTQKSSSKKKSSGATKSKKSAKSKG